MTRRKSFRTKIKTPLALRRALQASTMRNKRVVFTNGCFDLLHCGHVTYLECARKQGDVLVVALNSDASVKRLKGPERPINTLADRLEVIAALESVDYVTWFEENDPVHLIRLLRPRVLVKGGDWRPENILGSAEVLSWGGKVKSLPFVEGKSTTLMIQKSRSKSSEK